MQYQSALIVGAGSGLSASVARAFAKAGMKIALAARSTDKLDDVRQGDRRQDLQLRRRQTRRGGKAVRRPRQAPARPRTSSSTTPAPARAGRSSSSIRPRCRTRSTVSAFAGFLVAQAAVKRMLPRGHGAVLFTGASASIKGYAQSAPFAMGKFALRGLAQSMARELAPQGIHVAHFVIDGGIKSARRPEPPDKPDSMLDPDAIAETYLHVLQQPRSAWTWEVELRPWVEKF